MLISQNSIKDRWITIHPNGKDGKGKHILLEDGETPEEAIERLYGKKPKETKTIKENKLDEETKKWLEEKLYALNKLAKQYRPNINLREILDEDGDTIYEKIFDDKNKERREELYDVKDKILNKYGTPTGKVHKFPRGYGVEYSIQGIGSFHKYIKNDHELLKLINKEAKEKIEKDFDAKFNYTDNKNNILSPYTVELKNPRTKNLEQMELEDVPSKYFKNNNKPKWYIDLSSLRTAEEIYQYELPSKELLDRDLAKIPEYEKILKKSKSSRKIEVAKEEIERIQKRKAKYKEMTNNKQKYITEYQNNLNKIKKYKEADEKDTQEIREEYTRIENKLEKYGYKTDIRDVKFDDELEQISSENTRGIEINEKDIKKLKSMVNNQNDKDILSELIAMEESGATKEDIILAITKLKSKSSKKQLITNSLLELGDDITDGQKGKGRKFVSRFIEAGVAHYQDFGDVLITKETLDRFIHTMVGCPVIIQHKEITDKNADKERVGVVSNVFYSNSDGWYYCEGIIWNKQAIDLVKNQGWSVSCTYDFVSDNQEKTHNGKKIDMEFIDGNFLHLALVPNPRYERANIVINSKEDEELQKDDETGIKDKKDENQETEQKQAKNSIETERKDKIFMDVMDSLKDFILGVVGNECDKDKDKVENEDKRKIIDEIGGILKGKVDEEVWRTIVGKLEKVAYNPSETDKADNKAKNEDDKDKEKEKEEKYEKEKEIADVDNKCGKAKNSMDKAREIVYGGSQPEFKPSYVSREDRLKLGDNY